LVLFHFFQWICSLPILPLRTVSLSCHHVPLNLRSFAATPLPFSKSSGSPDHQLFFSPCSTTLPTPSSFFVHVVERFPVLCLEMVFFARFSLFLNPPPFVMLWFLQWPLPSQPSFRHLFMIFSKVLPILFVVIHPRAAFRSLSPFSPLLPAKPRPQSKFLNPFRPLFPKKILPLLQECG